VFLEADSSTVTCVLSTVEFHLTFCLNVSLAVVSAVNATVTVKAFLQPNVPTVVYNVCIVQLLAF
jgi:hypothetical protein